ncbi:hypothetical protein E1301_Tti010676 [Triplophysa tibetana]|uniref:Uncharacterized protein n=1 Tax=Triplophysa tibetana TaxID=1572043 RepID=A0A5A9PTT9_9TELE|nr:hypothetical protein E1301_Tti010676 [Triplophysa tibetana]
MEVRARERRQSNRPVMLKVRVVQHSASTPPPELPELQTVITSIVEEKGHHTDFVTFEPSIQLTPYANLQGPPRTNPPLFPALGEKPPDQRCHWLKAH